MQSVAHKLYGEIEQEAAAGKGGCADTVRERMDAEDRERKKGRRQRGQEMVTDGERQTGERLVNGQWQMLRLFGGGERRSLGEETA